jgi:hypothetical protein
MFFLLLLVSSFYFSCKKEEVGLPRIANGKINNIAIIVDDLLWNSEVGTALEISLLPQYLITARGTSLISISIQ